MIRVPENQRFNVLKDKGEVSINHLTDLSIAG